MTHIMNLDLAPRMCSAFSQPSVVSVGICFSQDRKYIRDRMTESSWMSVFLKSLVDFDLRQHSISLSIYVLQKQHSMCTLPSKMTIPSTDLPPFWLYCQKELNIISLNHIFCNSNTETLRWIIVYLMLILSTLKTLNLWMSTSVIFSFQSTNAIFSMDTLYTKMMITGFFFFNCTGRGLGI